MKIFTIFFALLLGSLTGFTQSVVISEIYGAGGNAGATLKSDFIELYNPTEAAVSLEGWSVQYASATGMSWAKTDLSGSIAAKGYYLIKEADGTGGTVNLPTPDKIGTLTMSGTNGKVALVNNTTLLTGTTPTGATVVDLVGYGITTGAETASTGTPLTATTSVERKANATSTAETMATGGADDLKGNGYDTNNNLLDFITKPGPVPQNSGSVTPITLKSFYAIANGNNVELKWVTSAEINNRYFEIQHSIDALNFTTITKIDGAINSANENSYQFTHYQPTQGVNYYRLTQTDFNGDSKAFEVKAVKILSATQKTLNIYPNPISINTQFTLNSNAKDLELKVLNANGIVVIKSKGSVTQINQYFNQNVANLASGIYFVLIDNATESYKLTIVK